MVCVEGLLYIVQAVFAPVGVHEFPVSGKALLLLSHGELVPRFSLVVVVVAGEACTDNN
jgi:hypothetical protein